MAEELYLPVPGVTAVLQHIFEAAGGAPDEAKRIADNLVEASLTGHDSHGVVRTEKYVDWTAGGGVLFGKDISIITDTDAFALLDGNHGFGQTVGAQAVEHGILKAKQSCS